MISFHPLGRYDIRQIVTCHARFVVYNEREHVLVELWIMRNEELHSVCQVRQRICRDVLLDGV